MVTHSTRRLNPKQGRCESKDFPKAGRGGVVKRSFCLQGQSNAYILVILLYEFILSEFSKKGGICSRQYQKLKKNSAETQSGDLKFVFLLKI